MVKTKKNTTQLRDKYLNLVRAMQSGVQMMMNYVHQPTSPKSLRVGINTALSDHGALVALLIERGLITEEEYYEKLVEFMGNEVQRYGAEINAQVGSDSKVKLG